MSDINYSELEMRVSQLAIEVQALKEHFKEINSSDIYTLSDSINDIKKELIDFKYNINTLQSNYSSVSQEIYSQEKELKKWAQKEFLSKSSLKDVDFNTFVTESELISKNYLNAGIAKDTYLTKIDFSNQLKNYLKSTDLKNYVTESALKTKLSSYLSISDAKNNYVHKDTISSYLTPYITKNELYEDYFTKSEIKGKYALKTDIPKLTSYVKRTELDNYVNNETIKRYTTLDNLYTILDNNNNQFYTKKYITDNFYTKIQSNNIFLTKSDAQNTYITSVDAGKIFLKIEDYRGLKDAMILNTSYKDRYDDFVKDLNNQQLKLGWYIVDDKAVLVNNNKVYSFRDPFSYNKDESDARFAKLKDVDQNIVLQDITFKGKYNLNVINERLCYENDFVVVKKNLNDYVQNHWIEDDELGFITK